MIKLEDATIKQFEERQKSMTRFNQAIERLSDKKKAYQNTDKPKKETETQP